MKSIIIAGATGGIGQSLVRDYLAQGYCVGLVARNADRLNALSETLKKQNKENQFYMACKNVSNPDEVKTLFKQHQEKTGSSPDVLLNLVGQQAPMGLTWKVSPEKWIDAIQQNLAPAFLLTHEAINQALSSNKPCSLIHFSGGGAAYARAYFSAYGCSKTALLRLVETAALELKEQSLSDLIQINAMAPGAIHTNMTQEILAAGKAGVGEKALLEAEETTANESNASLIKVVNLCRYLSDRKQNAGISGKLIHVNESYQTWGEQVKELNQSDWGLLRRVNLRGE